MQERPSRPLILYMKKIALSLVGLLALAWSALAGSQDFQLNNNTGFTVWAVYVSPSGANTWQEDVMHDDVLSPGSSVNVHFSPDENVEYWDLMVESPSGTRYSFYHIDLLTVSTIELTYNADTDVVTAHYDE